MSICNDENGVVGVFIKFEDEPADGVENGIDSDEADGVENEVGVLKTCTDGDVIDAEGERSDDDDNDGDEKLWLIG